MKSKISPDHVPITTQEAAKIKRSLYWIASEQEVEVRQGLSQSTVEGTSLRPEALGWRPGSAAHRLSDHGRGGTHI